eukprot:scaffold3437_cov113-Cylindrotheca_fusiformis.AAC.11
MQCLEAKDITLVLHALATQNVQNKTLFGKFIKQALSKAVQFNKIDILCILCTFAKMDIKEPELFDAMAEMAVSLIESFVSKDLTDMIGSYSKLRHYHTELFEAVAKRTLAIVSTLTSRDVLSIIDAFARFKHRNVSLLKEFASRATSWVYKLRGRDLCFLANNYARLRYDDVKLFDTISQAVRTCVHTLNAIDLSIVTASFAQFGRPYPTLFQELAAASLLLTHQYDAKGLVDLIKAHAKMNNHNVLLFDAAATAAIANMNSFNWNKLSTLANAYAKLGHSNRSLLVAMENRLVHLANSSKVHNPSLFSLLRVFEKMDYRPTKLLPLNVHATAALLDSEPMELLRMVNLFATTKPRDKFTSKAAERTIGKMLSLDNQSFLAVISTFSKIKYKELRFWESAGKEVASRKDSAWTAQDLGKLAIAFGRIETSASARVLNMAFRKFGSKNPEEVCIQDVIAISSVIPYGHRLQVSPSGFAEDMAILAMQKSVESRHDDVLSILMNFSKFSLAMPLRIKLLAIYWPIFNDLCILMSNEDRKKISDIYVGFDALHDDESWVTVLCCKAAAQGRHYQPILSDRKFATCLGLPHPDQPSIRDTSLMLDPVCACYKGKLLDMAAYTNTLSCPGKIPSQNSYFVCWAGDSFVKKEKPEACLYCLCHDGWMKQV